jgi:hypothetical protein
MRKKNSWDGSWALPIGQNFYPLPILDQYAELYGCFLIAFIQLRFPCAR